jgi:hypothetical protein
LNRDPHRTVDETYLSYSDRRLILVDPSSQGLGNNAGASHITARMWPYNRSLSLSFYSCEESSSAEAKKRSIHGSATTLLPGDTGFDLTWLKRMKNRTNGPQISFHRL